MEQNRKTKEAKGNKIETEKNTSEASEEEPQKNRSKRSRQQAKNSMTETHISKT